MPLKLGKSNIGPNIKELQNSGRGYKQSLAIALKTAGENKKPGSRLKRIKMGAAPKKDGLFKHGQED